MQEPVVMLLISQRYQKVQLAILCAACEKNLGTCNLISSSLKAGFEIHFPKCQADLRFGNKMYFC